VIGHLDATFLDRSKAMISQAFLWPGEPQNQGMGREIFDLRHKKSLRHFHIAYTTSASPENWRGLFRPPLVFAQFLL
jgi:hypothetical protein